MVDFEPAVKADFTEAGDRREDVSRLEPLLIGQTSRHRPALTDLALESA